MVSDIVPFKVRLVLLMSIESSVCGAENISSALNKLYAKRIGHCYSCINQPYLMGYLKRKNIVYNIEYDNKVWSNFI